MIVEKTKRDLGFSAAVLVVTTAATLTKKEILLDRNSMKFWEGKFYGRQAWISHVGLSKMG